MGKDIHAFIEIGNDSYASCYSEVYISRHTTLFDILGEFPVRGLPKKISGDTSDKFFIMVMSPEEELSSKEYSRYGIPWMPRHEADKYVAEDKSFYKRSEATGNDEWVSNPDWFGASWLTLEECENVLKRYREKSEHVNWDFAVIVDTMRSIEIYTRKGFTRLVFWFDW
jgi:hypothetical protein